MPIFRNIFSCRSSENQNSELDNLRERVNRLEIKYDNIKDILNVIKMDIKLINNNIQNALQQRKD